MGLGCGLRTRREAGARRAVDRGHRPRGELGAGRNHSADGRDHWPYCYTGLVAGAGIRRGHIHGSSDATASAPATDPVHPGELLATIYHAFGIRPETIVYNHLNQPRELVKAEAVTGLFG